jgi:hypothetical protein
LIPINRSSRYPEPTLGRIPFIDIQWTAMRLSGASLAVLLLVLPVSWVEAVNPLRSKGVNDVSTWYRAKGRREARMQQDAHSIVNRNLYHERDAIPSPATSAPNGEATAISTTSAVDETESWDKTTEAACLKALDDKGNATSSPCGMAACYNIKYFDNVTGVFQAELRLYRMAPATGNWAAMKSEGVNVTVSCKGASIATGTMQMGKRDGTVESPPQMQRLRIFRRSPSSPPKTLQKMYFYGEVQENLMSQIQSDDSARSLLAPTIAFSGIGADGTPLLADLSAKGTSFVNGMFSPTQLAASSGPGSDARPAGDAGFVMPGRTLSIFPVGLIITGVWTVMFLVTISVGTVDRVRFREAYRRRMKRELGQATRRI